MLVIPYGSPFFFGLAAYAVLPTVVQGVLGVLRSRWMLLVTLLASAVQLGMGGELLVAAGCVATHLAVILGFRRMPAIRGRTIASVLMVLAPIIAARVTGMSPSLTPFGFIGLSYITFRSLDVLLGLHDGTITELDLSSLLAYLLFFPTLSSGPIDRYKRFTADFRRPISRDAYVDLLDSAIPLLVQGLLYKFVVASLINEQLIAPLATRHDVPATIGYMYAYTAFLFFDFAGYSAMAVAASRVFGISTPVNFNRPFLARNIVDFWNRWHMSLSGWFRDHVYMRTVLAAKRGKWFSDRHLPSYFALLVSFGLMGVWHGFAWHFVVYGFYHAALQIGHSVFTRWNATARVWGTGPRWQVAGMIVTANAFAFGLLLFSGRLF